MINMAEQKTGEACTQTQTHTGNDRQTGRHTHVHTAVESVEEINQPLLVCRPQALNNGMCKLPAATHTHHTKERETKERETKERETKEREESNGEPKVEHVLIKAGEKVKCMREATPERLVPLQTRLVLHALTSSPKL